MYFNPFASQLLTEERMKDAMRQNVQARLIQVAQGSEKSWRWRLSMIWRSEVRWLSPAHRTNHLLKTAPISDE